MVGIPAKTSWKRVAAFAAGLGLAVLLGCTRGGPAKEKEAPPPEDKPKAEQQLPAEKPKPPSGREILQRMVDAYQKASGYADKGQARLDFTVGGRKDGRIAPFSLVFQRPNKLRLEAYGAMIVCDGKDLYASIPNAPQQVMRRPAPERLELAALFSDPMLAEAWTQGFGGVMPQVMLLLDKNPLDVLLQGTEDVTAVEPGEIEGRACHRVRLDRPEGAATFWIDRETYILRRLFMPTDPIRQELSREGRVESISLVADFLGAKLNGEVDPAAFRFEAPAGARIVKFFLQPPMTFLGEKAPALNFVDLDGKPLAVQSLAGKVVVLDFWATWCGPCRQSLPNLENIRRRFKDNPNVVFYAVSVDRPETDNKELAKMFEQLKVGATILRDPDKSAAALQFEAIPTLLVIGPDGVVQHCEIGGNPKLAELLPPKIEALLAGKSVFEESLREHDKQMEAFAKMIEDQLNRKEGPPADQRTTEERELPKVRTAPRSEPARLKLAPLWKCVELKSPGNVLVVRDAAGPPRLLVVENWNSVAEIGPDGKVTALHKLELGENEVVGSLRTAVGRDGKRYYAAYLISQQRCHVYDENWKLIAHYPEDALKNPHRGIADVQLGDLDGDGTPNLYVSYWGVVGVQGATLDGKRLWANRSMSEVACIAVGAPNAEGFCDLYCAAGSGAIVVLDPKGERRGEIVVPNRVFQWIAAADLRGDGRPAWCGIADTGLGVNTAVGFSPDGKELWSYALPKGLPRQPIEPIVPGRLAGDGPGRWILPGPDGSIHIISADGVPLDRFNYGAELHGLAAAEIDGRPVLVAAIAGVVEAWEVK